MTLDTMLTIALDAAYFAVLAFTFVDWVRHRGPVRRAIVWLFASLAIVLGAPLVRSVHEGLGTIATLAVVPALLAQPLLALRLVGFIRPLARWAVPLATVAFAGISITFFALLTAGLTTATPQGIILVLAAAGYYLVTEAVVAVGFAAAARERAGASRSRLTIAALATALLGMAVVVLLAAGILFGPGSGELTITNAAARVVALLAAFGYLVAFAPPRGLRRLSQQGIVYDFIRELNALPSGASIERIWALLEQAARRASGASRVQVVEQSAPAEEGARTVATRKSPSGERGPHAQRIAVPFHSQRWPGGRLELELHRQALFLDDDLELIELLVDRGVRAAERESFILERERLIAELRAASAAKSDFLAAMSHELRTPLNAIIGFSELLREDGEEAADPETVRGYSEHIHESGLHLLELVNDVLDLARVEAGRLDLKPLELDLDLLVRQTVASVQPLADAKDLSIRLDLAPVVVDADPSRTRQVVLNLLSNAIKFTADGGEIRLSLDRDPEGGDVRLRVADTGRGIAAADLDRIFEAFQQADGQTRATHHEGTGLGLALTRQLVEAHGGRVEVTSEVGVGSEFTVRLPARRAATFPAPAGQPSPATPGADRPPTVLVIEDDPAAQELLRVHLQGAGYAVLMTASGREGLAWMAEARPDAVLLDILLPDLDGWEVLQRAKRDPAIRSIPVMVVSVVDDRPLGLALGAIDYVVKPVSRERLLEALGRLTFTTKVRSRTVTALVIDADPAAAGRYRELLEPDGFRVIAAPDAASGRRRAREDRPDLILLDALLPGSDGFGLAQALRRDPVTAAIPIWLTTPAGLPSDAKERLNGTVQGVLARGDDALVALRSWLEIGGPPARPVGPADGASAPAVPARGSEATA